MEFCWNFLYVCIKSQRNLIDFKNILSDEESKAVFGLVIEYRVAYAFLEELAKRDISNTYF